MKNLYTILGAIALTSSLSAQTYLDQDFETSLAGNGWENHTITGTTDWYLGDNGGSNSYAKISNYDNSTSSNSAALAWFVSPSVDLSTATTPLLSFETVANFSGDPLQLMISTDYDGTSDPSTQGTWTDITSSANWDTDLSSWGFFSDNLSGDIDISAYASANTYIAFVYTGSANDGSTWEVDNILINETGSGNSGGSGGTATDASIYEIQYSTGSPADSPFDGQLVNTGGIVSHVRVDGNFFISSGTGPYSGIYVFDSNNAPAIGDSVKFTAEVVEFYELTELKNLSNFSIVSSGNFFMSNSVTTAEASSEAYEGCLIATCGVCTAAENQYNEYPINDGSGDAIIDDFLIGASNFVSPTVGNSYNARGVVDYSFGEFKVLPLTTSDISVTGSCTPISVEEDNVSFEVYPNPANDILNIDFDGNSSLTILDINGKIITNKLANGFTAVNISNLESGVYFVKIGNKVTKFIKG